MKLGMTAWSLLVTSHVVLVLAAKKTTVATCSVTKGGALESFLKAKAEVEIPCRYIVGEFFCHSKTRIVADNALAKDKRTFVSSVTVRKSLDPTDTSEGGVVSGYEEVTLNVTTLGQMLNGEGIDQSWSENWTLAGNNVYISSDGRWEVTLDGSKQEGTLTDTHNALQVTLSYVDPEMDMSKAGGLVIACPHSSFGPVAGSSGYLCGRVGEGGDDQHHLREAASAVNLSVTDYITFSVLAARDPKQTDPQCKATTKVTSTCVYSLEAVNMCAQFLHRSTYVYKCFQERSVSPIQAFTACVRLRCRKDWLSCNQLAEVLGDCPRYKNDKRQLFCETVRREEEE